MIDKLVVIVPSRMGMNTVGMSHLPNRIRRAGQANDIVAELVNEALEALGRIVDRVDCNEERHESVAWLCVVFPSHFLCRRS